MRDKNKKQLNVEVSSDFHTSLKIDAARHRMSLGKYLRLIYDYFKGPLPPSETAFWVSRFGKVPVEAEVLSRLRECRRELENGSLGLDLTLLDKAIQNIETQLGLPHQKGEGGNR